MSKVLDWLDKEGQTVPQNARLPLALGIAVCFALVLTFTSVAIYVLGGSYKLDLSRPGFEREQAAVRSTNTQITYDTSSPITLNTTTGFLSEFDSRAKTLSEYGAFNDQALDDATLQIEARNP